MPIMKVTVNGAPHIVDAPDVRTAKAWGRSQVRIGVEVGDATAADLQGLDFSKITVVPKTAPAVVDADATLDSKPVAGVFGKLLAAGAR